ncbi:DUF397 domain-containing protein [Sphaerisporangium corydalis]|uniref:DUF397 domain-containing protein n=1 Tax=Sphaerisporangium corydalis TaxID=1441875 RepID=A0ABV9EAI9_9ACTN|nr:DUF397 domain-containing protein [Sphaerisporangium corydalis]
MDLSSVKWRKSTRSGDTGGHCVEVASDRSGTIAVRDSKNPEVPALIVTSGQWSMFLRGVKRGAPGWAAPLRA